MIPPAANRLQAHLSADPGPAGDLYRAVNVAMTFAEPDAIELTVSLKEPPSTEALRLVSALLRMLGYEMGRVLGTPGVRIWIAAAGTP